MESHEHYYAEGYGAESDPYAMPNGVLINNLGITETRELNEIEQDLSALSLKELAQEALPETFNFAHLRHLHKRIFDRVYPWAGELRTVDIGKGDTLFIRHQDIEKEAQKLFAKIQAEDLQNVSLEVFSQTVGEFFIALNHIHPFREGNGRTQRLFASQLAAANGKTLNWESVGDEAMRRACIEGAMGNIRQMVRLILLNTKQ
jgi:cell filamentation protein